MQRSVLALPHRALRLAALFGTLSLGSVAMAATSLQFAPTYMVLQGNQRATSLNIKNISTQTATFTAELVAWAQDGEDRYTPSRDFVLNPVRFTLRPGQEQTVRLALRGNLPPSERLYRVYISEQPGAPGADGTSTDTGALISTLYKIGLPLFVLPTPGQAVVNLSIEKQGNATNVIVRNDGNRYTLLRDFQVVAGDKQTNLKTFNLLAGGFLRFPLPDLGGANTVDVRFIQGNSTQEQRVTLKISP